MLKTKKGGSILVCRWGRKRSPSRIVRVSPWLRSVLDKIPQPLRRRFLDDVVKDWLSRSDLASYR